MSIAVSKIGKKTIRTLRFTPEDHVAPIVITVSNHVSSELDAGLIADAIASLLDRHKAGKP